MRAEVLRRSKAIGTVLGRVQLRSLDADESRISDVLIASGVGKRLYNMLFEPFDGRLIGCGRYPSKRSRSVRFALLLRSVSHCVSPDSAVCDARGCGNLR